MNAMTPAEMVIARARDVAARPGQAEIAALTAALSQLDRGCPHILDEDKCVLIGRSGHCRLSPMKAKLLAALLHRRGATVSYRALAEALYGDDVRGGPDGPEPVIRVFVSHLRRSIRVTDAPLRIVNLHGIGFRAELLQ